MWIALAIIIFALLMMVGPLMAIRPTKSQNRLANLRRLALKEGLSVTVRQDPSAFQRGPVAVYMFHLPLLDQKNTQSDDEQSTGPKSVRKASRWLLTRTKYSHGLHFQGEWDWQGEDRPAHSLQEFLKQQVGQLDETFLAIESNGHSFGLYWTERLGGQTGEQRVGHIAAWLKSLAQHEKVREDPVA